METTLSDIADGCKYGFVDGPFGSNLPSSCYKHKGIPVIRGCNLSIGKFRYIDQGYCFVDNIVLDKLSRSTARKFDIIFTKKRNNWTNRYNTKKCFVQFVFIIF